VTSPENTEGDSKPVHSNQSGLHPNLARVVQRHLDSPHRAKISDHSVHAYQQLRHHLEGFDGKLVLDSFCGTGHSTHLLAQRHPDHLVIGIDKSSHRLSKHPFPVDGNYQLLQANCEEIWQLLVSDGIRLRQHHLLYPNPWPKSRQLQRRIHGHPGFPLLKELGGTLELRSNWQLYVEEFGTAMHLLGEIGAIRQIATTETAMTLFEKKYRDSGHPLWAYNCDISG
jgi:tRNA (guanine-N7-)-methyltransferase